MKKTIVMFSNPFGYGPTGNAIPVMKSLLDRPNGFEVVFAGSGLCIEVTSAMPIRFVHLDERNEIEIENFLKTIQHPYIISSQNRFCIKAARKMGIPCAFIDMLAWFWKEIPADHLLADEIFWTNFPQIRKKYLYLVGKKNIHIVSSIITTIPSSGIKQQKQLIIHIGGAKYPLMEKLPYNYLNLISAGLNGLATSSFFDRVLCAGGSEAIAYLKKRVADKSMSLVSLPKERFIEELEKSSHIFTIAGVSSTLESFALNVPVSFLLPLNLSQVAFKDVLDQQKVPIQSLEWSDYIDISVGLRAMNERDALAEIDKYAELVSRNGEKIARFAKDFVRMAQSIPDNTGQRKLIKYMGVSGADEIADILFSAWSFN